MSNEEKTNERHGANGQEKDCVGTQYVREAMGSSAGEVGPRGSGGLGDDGRSFGLHSQKEMDSEVKEDESIGESHYRRAEDLFGGVRAEQAFMRITELTGGGKQLFLQLLRAEARLRAGKQVQVQVEQRREWALSR